MTTYKDALEEIKKAKHDFITFLSGDKKDSIVIMASDYNKPGKSVSGSTLGEMYHIV